MLNAARRTLCAAALALAAAPTLALNFGPAEVIQSGGADLVVDAYSVPDYADWNNDGLMDLIVGENYGYSYGKVRVYLNTGSAKAPAFSGYSYAQADGADLDVPAGGCLGAFPRVIDWDMDGRKDLLIGRADGKLQLFLNSATDAAPAFTATEFIEAGPAGSKTDIDVGMRNCVDVVDWDNDGARDLVLGSIDAKVRLYLNAGTDAAPDFQSAVDLQDGGATMYVYGTRSSPEVADLDLDGRKDLLVGNTNGQLMLYSNVGTDAAPVFSGYTEVTSDGVAIDLSSSRTRPTVVDWTGNGLLDVLLGSSDGRVRLYRAAPLMGDANLDGLVSDADYTLWADHYEAENPTWLMGDFNDDGSVTDADYTLWADHYSAAGAGVPEPTALGLLAVGLLLRRRR